MVLLLALTMAVSAMVYHASPSVQTPHVTDRVILTPSPDGSVGRVVVTSAAGTQDLAKAYEALSVAGSGAITKRQDSAESVNARFAALLQARPQPASHHVLYFESGTTQLTPSSEQLLTEVLSALQTRPVPEILVIGHADTRGRVADSQSLSLQRAQRVRERLTRGANILAIEVVGRGTSDPLVPTGPNVDEPRNRRVELSIR